MIFVLPGFWLAPILLFIYFFTKNSYSVVIIALFLLFACGHLLGPIQTYFKSPQIRAELLQNDPLFNVKILTFFFTPIFLMMLSAYLYNSLQPEIITYSPLFIVFLIYFIFNSWHFCMQNYGVVRTYKKILNLTEKFNVDYALFVFFQFFIITLVWYKLNIRNEFLTQINLHLPKEMFFIVDYAGAAFFIAFTLLILRYRKYPTVCLSYIHYFLIHLLVLLDPLYFTLTLYSGAHHIQELGFNSQISQRANLIKNTKKYISYLILLSLIFGLMHLEIINFIPNITLFGAVDYSKKFSSGLYLISCAFFGFWMGINFLHFFISKHLYTNKIYQLLGKRGSSSEN